MPLYHCFSYSWSLVFLLHGISCLFPYSLPAIDITTLLLINFSLFNFSGDGRVKMPLSPTIAAGQHRPFGTGHGFSGSSIQLMESSLYPSTSSVSHSYSSGSLGQMQVDNSTMGSFWSPHRSQMRLQSRRSQSREDLNSSLAEPHLVKV